MGPRGAALGVRVRLPRRCARGTTLGVRVTGMVLIVAQ